MAVDRHSHILFGVDDGSCSIDESCAMLAAARKAGVSSIVCTPHCRGSRFDFDKISRSFATLRPRAEMAGVMLLQGYEVYYDKLLELGLEYAEDLCTRGTKDLLLELPLGSVPIDLERTIFELTGRGLRVTIAHPERYAAVQRDIGLARRLVDMGCRLQLSADFIGAGVFSSQRRTAGQLLREGLVACVGSDAHAARDYRHFAKVLLRSPRHAYGV